MSEAPDYLVATLHFISRGRRTLDDGKRAPIWGRWTYSALATHGWSAPSAASSAEKSGGIGVIGCSGRA
jgi:hypothetical protein